MKHLEYKLTILALAAVSLGLNAKSGHYAQLSLSHDQRPTTTAPTKVILDTDDGRQGIQNENGNVTLGSDGLYLIFAAPQVGRTFGDNPGWVSCWLRVNDKDVTNSNVLLQLDSQAHKDVIISQGAMRLKKGDKLNVMMGIQRTGEGLGLEAIRPANQPLVPGIIFTIAKIAD